MDSDSCTMIIVFVGCGVWMGLGALFTYLLKKFWDFETKNEVNTIEGVLTLLPPISLILLSIFYCIYRFKKRKS